MFWFILCPFIIYFKCKEFAAFKKKFTDTDNSIKNIGKRTGRLLFFGGVYGNLQALQALKTWAEKEKFLPDNIICTGDIMGYCAQPLECIELINNWGIHCISGNVEIQVRENVEDCGCNFAEGSRCDKFSNVWFPYTKIQMTEDAIIWLKSLPAFISLRYLGKSIFVLPGSRFDTSGFIFNSTPWKMKHENFTATGADIIIAGHSGLPFMDAQEDLEWINAGAMGMPANDGKTSVWGATLQAGNNDKPTTQFHALEYDFTTTAALMTEKGLPGTYALTLKTGIWDNCEILPDIETSEQGKEMQF